MLMPIDTKPKYTIYYLTSIVLKELLENKYSNVSDLYNNKIKNEMSYSLFHLCLDFLFLIDVIEIKPNGEILKCS